jgi:hypothetical protein
MITVLIADSWRVLLTQESIDTVARHRQGRKMSFCEYKSIDQK